MREELNHFFATEYHRLVGFVKSRLDNVADRDATDIVQEVAYGLFEKADISEPVANLSAYVYRSLRNRIIDYLRKPKRPLSLDSPIGDEEEPLALVDILPALTENVDLSLERAELQAALMTAIGRLDPSSREVIMATEFEGRSFRELAEEWEIPIGTLLARKSRAIGVLARMLVTYREHDRSLSGRSV